MNAKITNIETKEPKRKEVREYIYSLIGQPQKIQDAEDMINLAIDIAKKEIYEELNNKKLSV